MLKRMSTVLAVLCLLAGAASPARAETVAEYVQRTYPEMDEIASSILEPLGTMSTWEKLFVDRLATLTPESQRSYATSLAMDGRITAEDLAELPVNLTLPEDPAGIIALLTEHVRADYWPGFYRRHSFSVHRQLRHWAETAERRYDDPELCKKLIEIFFAMVDGKYDGPMEIEYRPTSRDIHRPAE